MKKETFTKLFIILCGLNITLLLISNIVAIKTINILGYILTAADLIFPITYILNDVFTEVYGFNKAKFVIWLSFAANLIMVILFAVVINVPADDSFTMQESFENVLGSTPRVLFASFIAFLAGNLLNSLVLSKIKVKTKGKYLGLRTISSTLIGAAADTLLFVPIVYIGTLSVDDLISLGINMYILKVLVEVIFTPITYKIISIVKKKENIDTYDENIEYKIF